MSSATDIKQPAIARPVVIDKSALMPLGLFLAGLIAVGSFVWQARGVWSDRGYEIKSIRRSQTELVLLITKQDKRLHILEEKLGYWRLDIERKLGNLPPIPSATKTKGVSDANHRRTNHHMQDNQVWKPSGESLQSRRGDSRIRSGATNLPQNETSH